MDSFDFVCVHLNSRPDRKTTSLKLFEQLDLSDQINWWTVDKHPAGGIYGCFESHYGIWNSSQFKNKYLCVFEDDLRLNEDFGKEDFQKMLTWFQQQKNQCDWMNLEPALGFKQTKIVDLEKNSVWSGFFFHTGCYLVKRTFLPEISERIRSWYGMDLDTALYQNCRMMGTFPPIFKQLDETDSDNGGGWRTITEQIRTQVDLSKMKQMFRPDRSPWWGWLCTEWSQLGSWYLLLHSPPPELTDRRVHS